MTSNLIQLGDFQLNSGLKSTWKLDCDQFIEDNLDGLVQLIKQVIGPFSHVYGVPRGGSALETKLVAHVSKSLYGTCLVIDDVLTTGGSMRRAREKLAGTYTHILGCVVFARGPCPAWIVPLFQMSRELFIKGT